MGRRSYGMVLDRSDLYGNDVHRNGVLHGMDVSLRGIRTMREVTIILLILILAVWMWRPRKGGKRGFK